MFQVSDVTIDTNSRDPTSAYLMSVRIWETDVIKEQWFYEEFTNQATDGGPIITSKPSSITLQYDQMYEDQYGIIVLASRNLFLSKPENLRTVILTEIAVSNLFQDKTVLGISVMTDYTEKFVKLFQDFEVKKGARYVEDTKLECFEYIVIRVETSEGFHTKEFKCEDPKIGEVSETFVPKMSSMVKAVKISNDYSQLASELAAPLEGDFIPD